MKRSALALPAAIVLLAAALLVAGCGGDKSESVEQNALPPHNQGFEDGGSKATAPNAPAGSKVIACDEGRLETRELRATQVDCFRARKTMRRWESSHACTLGDGSRSSCSVDSFRCQAVKVGKGASVSCAGPHGDVSWISTAWLAKKAGG
jgi:hypothetical protein